MVLGHFSHKIQLASMINDIAPRLILRLKMQLACFVICVYVLKTKIFLAKSGI